MSDSINSKLPGFCPCQTCNFYQQTDNQITKDGLYKTKNDRTPRPMYYCHGGKHRFSETRYSDLSNKQGRFKEYEMASIMGSYGLSAEKIADVFERDVRILEEWLRALGKNREKFHVFLCLTLKLKFFLLQLDELWSVCQAKSHQLWVVIALDGASQFWIHFERGSRTN